ncbi:MAG: glucose dehydrogenase [Nitrososphaeraceae archaeon]|nr:glucose dehydrogenase [Nitrososphaeraceae archaeon]
MDKKYLLVVLILVLSLVTFFMTPSRDTIIPIPEPYRNLNDNNQTQGVLILAKNLDTPSSIDISDKGKIFFTEKNGQIRIIEDGKLLNQSMTNIAVENKNEGGLLGITLHPNFTLNHLLYVYHTYKKDNNLLNKVLLLKERNNKVTESKTIIDNIPAASFNNGGVIRFGMDGKLYVGTGDAQIPHSSQNLSTLAGKILRLNFDGTIPNDNPIKNSSIFSYGHRDVVGLTWNSNTHEMYSAERGPQGFDEINIIIPGKNYGWPIEKCSGTSNVKFEQPIFCFNPSIEPSGIIFPKNVTNEAGELFISTLRGSHLRQIDLESKDQNNILVGYGRLGDIVQDRNGSLYAITSNTDDFGIKYYADDKILKILNP